MSSDMAVRASESAAASAGADDTLEALVAGQAEQDACVVHVVLDDQKYVSEIGEIGSSGVGGEAFSDEFGNRPGRVAFGVNCKHGGSGFQVVFGSR
jgi:hypothetical protein